MNTLVHLDRRTRRRPTCELNDQTEPTCDPFGEREEQEQREQHAKTCGRIVRDLMNGLKPRYARALELRAEGKSLKEIAAEFGVTPERARQIVFKAITTVKRSKDLKAFEDEYDASLQALE